MEGTTKVRIDLRERVVELEGSEDFVTNQLDWLKDLVLSTPPLSEMELSNQEISQVPDNTNNQTVTSPDRYMKVFGVPKEIVDTVIHTDDAGFQIITTKIKGGTKDKQIALSLLHCLASEFYGREAISDEIREVCKTYACFDSGNFAGNLRDCTNLFLMVGKKASKTWKVKLTVPGKKEAQALLASLGKE